MAENSEKEVKTARKQRGKPFKPGQSGNPGGRPKVDPTVKAILDEAAVKAAKKLVLLANSDDEKVALAACREVLDRTQGKPIAIVAGDINHNHSFETSLELEVRKALAESGDVMEAIQNADARRAAQTDR